MARSEPDLKEDCCGQKAKAIFWLKPWKCLGACCPPVKESKSTKLIYSLMLVTATAVMSSMTIPGMQRFLQSIFRDFSATCTDLNIVVINCHRLTGYMAILKISVTFFIFFLTFSIFTFGVTSSKGTRAYVHNGFWIVKLMIVSSLLIAIFVIPISHLSQLHTGWIYTSMLGNLIFILVQLFCLIDFSGLICSSLAKMAENRRFGKMFQTSLAILIISIWLIMSIVLFLIHGQQEFCLTKQLSLILSTFISICIILAALTPCARRVRPSTSSPSRTNWTWKEQQAFYTTQLIQAGMVVIYVTFWIWSAMQSAPEEPGFVEKTFLFDDDELTCYVSHNLFVEQSLTYTAIVMMLFTIVYIGSSYAEINPEVSRRGLTRSFLKKRESSICLSELHSPFGGAKAYISRQENSLFHQSQQPHPHQHPPQLPAPPPAPAAAPAEKMVVRNEILRSTYSYSLFHIILALATMFVSTQLTRWFQPDDYKLLDLDRSWSKVGLKMFSAWSCGLLYLLYLLLPDRCVPTKIIRNAILRHDFLPKTPNNAVSINSNQDLHI